MKIIMKLARLGFAFDIFFFLCACWLLVDGWINGHQWQMALSAFAIATSLFSFLYQKSPRGKRAREMENKIATFREAGFYPPSARATEDDVRRLLQIGEKILAVRLYREIYGVSPKEAVEIVKRMK